MKDWMVMESPVSLIFDGWERNIDKNSLRNVIILHKSQDTKSSVIPTPTIPMVTTSIARR